MGSKSAGPGGQNDVPAFDMPPTQQVAGQQQGNINPQQIAGILGLLGGGMGGASSQPLAPWNVNNPTGGGPNIQPFSGQQRIPAGMGPGLGGQGPRPQMSPEDTIRMMYMTQLGRAPEQGGMDYWRQQLAGGMSPDQIRDAFRSSQEGQAYQQRMRPMTDDFGRGRQQMPLEVLDALRIALGGGRGRTYDPNAPRPYMGDPAAIEIAQRMGKNPNSPEVQDALRASRGLPVY